MNFVKLWMRSSPKQRTEERLEKDKQCIKFDPVEFETRGMTPEQIEELMIERQAELRVAEAEAPDKEQKKRVRDLEQEIADLQYVKNEEGKAVQDLVAREIDAREAAKAKSLEIQLEFCQRHPEYERSMDNGNQMRDWVKARFSEFTATNLEKAFETLRSEGKIKVLSDEEIRGQQRLQAAVQDGAVRVVPTRRASSVSSAGSTSLYDTKRKELSEEDLYNMPLDKLEELAGGDARFESVAKFIIKYSEADNGKPFEERFGRFAAS